MRNILYCFLLLFAVAGIRQCHHPDAEEMIMTVNGPVAAEDMGITLTHEHLLVDFIGADSTGPHRWNREEVVRVVVPYLREARKFNVKTLFECTPEYLGRDPELLRMLSRETGMHLVTNTGYYGARNNQYLPQSFHSMSAETIAALWISEYENGIGGTGIRPGFIKIGVDGNDTLSPAHRKIVHAAALAHLETGLTIASHTGPDGPAFEQIQLLQFLGVDLSSFVWVHAQGGSLEGNIRAARTGCWISLDNVDPMREPGAPNDLNWYADRVLALKEAGLLNRVLISHDAGWYSPGEKDGGSFRGFTGIFEALLPALEERGFSKGELDQLLIGNPRSAFALKSDSPL